MLDLTVVRFKDKASFAGVWLRPRSQLPIGFGDATRGTLRSRSQRREGGIARQLTGDQALLDRYYDWWYGKRREFLEAMRDHLRQAGVNPNAVILYTADPSEPGTTFPTWEKQFVTDNVADWKERLEQGSTKRQNSTVTPIDLKDVVQHRSIFRSTARAPSRLGRMGGRPQFSACRPGTLQANGGRADDALLQSRLHRRFTRHV